MRSVQYAGFSEPLNVVEVPDPEPPADGVVIDVHAAGLCRSDWHGWHGHDDDITTMPHVPGHEFAGVITAVGPRVRAWRIGERVTAPFVVGCGVCPVCRAGDGQVCPNQWQPGFHGAGAFAERIAVPRADANLVRIPDSVDLTAAALLGCRFATGFRATVAVGAVQAGEDVVVLGCGGLGLAIITIAAALGATVTAVDRSVDALALARTIGARHAVLAGDQVAIDEALPRGADVSFDATGSVATAHAAVMSLRPRGRHVQVGLLPTAEIGDRASIPMGRVIARELTVHGSHGMAPGEYPAMLDFIVNKGIDVGQIITRRIRLDDVDDAMRAEPWPAGVTMIDPRAC